MTQALTGHAKTSQLNGDLSKVQTQPDLFQKVKGAGLADLLDVVTGQFQAGENGSPDTMLGRLDGDQSKKQT